MRALFVCLSALSFTACQCGPGLACRADADCSPWGRCSTQGFCVTREGTGGGAGGGVGGGGAGEGVAVLSATSVDVGLAGCGTTDASASFQVINPGSGPLSFSTSVGASTDFTVTPGGTVAAGAMAAVTVTATPAASAAAGQALSGTLVITTDDPAHPRFELPLAATAAGVTLTLSPSLSSFGVVPLGTSAPAVPLTLKNVGNLPATVSFGAPADAQFSLAWTGAPLAQMLAPGDALPGLSAGFTPDRITPSSTSAAIAVAEPVCGESASTVLLTGQGTNGVVGLSTTDVLFGQNGRVDCGAQAAQQTLVLTNGGNQAYSWSGTLGRGAQSPFTATPSSGTVPANGGSVTVTVSTQAIPAEASTAADAFGDVFTVVTDAAGDTPHPVNLHQTAQGAALRFDPASIDFGLVPVSTRSTAPFNLVNDGNAPAHVTLAPGDAAFSVSAAGTTLASPGALALSAAFSPGSDTSPRATSVVIAADAADVLCAPLPNPLALSGSGSNGAVAFSPVALDFGQVDCGATAGPRTVTFTNAGNQDYTVTPSLGKGGASPYALTVSPASGVAAADGGTVVITVTPAAVPQTSDVTPNLYGDTLTVTTDVTGDVPHDVALRQTAHGAIFALSTTALDFGSVPVGVASGSQFSVTNNGNAAGTLAFSPAQPSIFNLPATVTVGAAAAAIATATFSPQATMTYSDTATLTAPSTVLCHPLPSTTLGLTGVGSSANVVAVSPQSLSFGASGLVPCGSQAAALTVGVTNNSSQVLTLGYALAKGAGSPFTVSGPGTVGIGATVMVTVTPLGVPSTASTQVDDFGDTLAITATGGAVNEGHTIALHQTAQGAILSFNPTSLSFKGSQQKNFVVSNAGNLAAPCTFTLGGANPGNFSVNPTSASVSASGSVSEAVTFSPPLLGSRSADLSISTTAGLCAPLPAAVALSGTP